MHNGRALPRTLTRAHIHQFLFERGGLLAITTLVVYGWIAPPHFIFGDNAEFSGLGAIGGVAHPSGYPLYVLWLRAWSWLPVSTPAHAAALATVILTAAEVLALHAACRAWGARARSATIATALFVAGPIALRIQSTAEVFALNGLVVATIVWLSSSNGPLQGHRRVLALGLVAGLGLSDHLSCALVAPVGLLGAVRGLREAQRSRASAALLGLLGVALGLTPYLYLLWAPDSPLSWRPIDNLGQLVHHFLRADYGSGKLSGRGGAPDPAAHLLALLRSAGRAYLWVPAALGVGGLGYFAVRGGGSEKRLGWVLYLVAFLLAGPLFTARFNIRPQGVGLYTVQRLHALPLLLFAVPLAAVLEQLLRQIQWSRPRPVLAECLLVLGFVAAIGMSLPDVWRAHSPAAERALDNALRTLPEDAVLIGSTDEFHFGLGYLQYAMGERRDVVTIALPQVGLPNYRERIRQRLGFVIENVSAKSGEKLSVKIAEQVLATGRPLFIDPYQANIAAAFPSYPYGLLFRILPRGTPPPPIEEVFALNRDLFARYRFDYPIPGTNDVLATQYHFHYARVWSIIADALGRAGKREDQAFALEMVEALKPR